MKAIVFTKYGPPDVLHLEEVKKPALNEEKVLVKVRPVPDQELWFEKVWKKNLEDNLSDS